MAAGPLDQRAQFMRRTVTKDADGQVVSVGDYAPIFHRWANFRPLTAREAAQGGAAQNVASGVLTIRDGPQARTIVNGDRVQLLGRDFNIDGVALPDRSTGTIALNISSTLGGA